MRKLLKPELRGFDSLYAKLSCEYYNIALSPRELQVTRVFVFRNVQPSVGLHFGYRSFNWLSSLIPSCKMLVFDKDKFLSKSC